MERDVSVMTKKKIPSGKKGKGLRALKKKAPKVAKAMGYKKGGKVRGCGMAKRGKGRAYGKNS